MRGIQLLDVLAQRYVNATRSGQQVEGGIQGRCLGREQERLGGELREGAGIRRDRPHAIGDRTARRPPSAGPGIEDGVARRGEGGQLSVEHVVGGGREVALQ